MKYLVPVLVAVGLAVVPGLATAQDFEPKTLGKVDADNKVSSKIANTDKSKDIAASKADADARAHNASKLWNKSNNEAKGTGGSSRVKSFNENDNKLKNDIDNTLKNDNTLRNDNTLKNDITVKNNNKIKIGDINNTNYNDNKQNVTIGVPVVPVRK